MFAEVSDCGPQLPGAGLGELEVTAGKGKCSFLRPNVCRNVAEVDGASYPCPTLSIVHVLPSKDHDTRIFFDL